MKTSRYSFLLFISSILFFHSLIFSQTTATGSTIGNQKVINVPISSDGTQGQALLWLPDDYAANPTKKYPLLIFLHGAGEGTSTNISQVLNTSLPQLISQGLKPYGIDPNTGETVKYIIVSPHAAKSSWSYQFTHVKNILPNIEANYRVDVNRVIISGLSAGGYGTWTVISDADVNWLKTNITAIVPISTAEIEPEREAKLGNAAKGDVAVWAICGTADSHWTGAERYKQLVDAAGPTKPNVLIGVAGASHTSAAWTPPYTQEYTGFNGKNLWSRMLDYSRSGTQPPPTTPPANQSPVAKAGNDVNITLPTNSTQVSGSASSDPDGSVASYSWARISGPTQYSISNSNIVNPLISNLVAGAYVFRLTVADNNGATATDDITINVNSSTTPPPPPPSGSTKYIKVNVFGGSSPYTSSEWNNWDATASLSSGALKYSDGTSSSASAVLSASIAVTDNEASYTGGMVPAEVLRFTSYSEAQRTLTFNGLAASKTYSLELYASRAVNPGESTIYSSGQASATVPSYNNHDTKAILSNLVADAQGKIVVTIKSAAAYNYLNGFILTDGNTSTGSNSPPVANAGADKNITGSTTTLTGSGTDSDGTIASYLWSKVSGPSGGAISSPTQAQTGLTGLVQGTYVFSLKVTDNQGATATDNVTVTVGTTAPPATTKYIKVNLYGGTNPYTNSEWNNWNVSTGTSNLSSGSLKYSDGSSSSISAVLSSSVGVVDNGSGYGSGMAPAQVLRYTSYSQSQRTITFSGLVASRAYKLEFYASRAANQNETTIFSSGTASATVSTYNNYNTKANLSNLVANSQGRIVITIRDGRDYNYLNGFMLTDGGSTASAQGSAIDIQQRTIASDVIAEEGLEVFNAYPNPVTDQFSLRINNGSMGKATVQVLDISGNLKKTYSFTKNQRYTQTNLSIGELPSGAYIISVQIGDWKNAIEVLKL